MFKYMNHEYIIHRKCFIGTPDYGFCVKLFIKRNTILPRTHMILTTNHLLKTCNQIDTILNNNNITPFYIKKLNIQKQIYFPKSTCYATYKYIFPPISLEKNNTFIFTGDTNFTKINVQFVAENSFLYEKYELDIKDMLLK